MAGEKTPEKTPEKKQPRKSAMEIAVENFNSVMADAESALKSKDLHVVGGRESNYVDGPLYHITVKRGK